MREEDETGYWNDTQTYYGINNNMWHLLYRSPCKAYVSAGEETYTRKIKDMGFLWVIWEK